MEPFDLLNTHAVYGKVAVLYYKAIDIVKGMANARPYMPYSYGFRRQVVRA